MREEKQRGYGKNQQIHYFLNLYLKLNISKYALFY